MKHLFSPCCFCFVFSLKPWLNPTVSSFSGDAEAFSVSFPTCPDSRSNSTECYASGHKTSLFPGRIGNAWRRVFLWIYLTALAGPRPCPQIFARSPRVNLPKGQLTGGMSWNPCSKTSGSVICSGDQRSEFLIKTLSFINFQAWEWFIRWASIWSRKMKFISQTHKCGPNQLATILSYFHALYHTHLLTWLFCYQVFT